MDSGSLNMLQNEVSMKEMTDKLTLLSKFKNLR